MRDFPTAFSVVDRRIANIQLSFLYLKYWREKPTKTDTPTNKKCGTEGVQHYFTDFARSIIFTLGYYNFSIYQLILFCKNHLLGCLLFLSEHNQTFSPPIFESRPRHEKKRREKGRDAKLQPPAPD